MGIEIYIDDLHRIAATQPQLGVYRLAKIQGVLYYDLS